MAQVVHRPPKKVPSQSRDLFLIVEDNFRENMFTYEWYQNPHISRLQQGDFTKNHVMMHWKTMTTQFFVEKMKKHPGSISLVIRFPSFSTEPYSF